MRLVSEQHMGKDLVFDIYESCSILLVQCNIRPDVLFIICRRITRLMQGVRKTREGTSHWPILSTRALFSRHAPG